MTVRLKLPVELTEEDGCFIAICPVFCVGSQGQTKEKALENAREALELYLEDEDVQKEHAQTILDYAVSFILSDKEKRFIKTSHNRIIHGEGDSHVTNLLDVDIHGILEPSKPVGV